MPPTKYKASSWAVWAALLSVYVIWGSTYLAIRFAVETMPPFLFASVRFLVAGAVLYFFRRLRGDPRPSVSEWRSAAVIGLCLLAGGNGGVVWAEQRVPSGLAALMIGSTPLWIALLDWVRPFSWLRRDAAGGRPHPRVLLGVAFGFVGVLLLIGGGPTGSRINLAGAAALIFATISWATGSLFGRSARLPASPLLGTGMEMLAGGAGLLLLGTVSGEWGRLALSAISARSLLAMAYLIVIGSWVAFSAYVWLLRNAPTPLVATYAYVNPVVAIFLGNLLAAEPITPRVLLAAAIILGAVVLTTTAQWRPRRRPGDLRTAEAVPDGE